MDLLCCIDIFLMTTFYQQKDLQTIDLGAEVIIEILNNNDNN